MQVMVMMRLHLTEVTFCSTVPAYCSMVEQLDCSVEQLNCPAAQWICSVELLSEKQKYDNSPAGPWEQPRRGIWEGAAALYIIVCSPDSLHTFSITCQHSDVISHLRYVAPPYITPCSCCIAKVYLLYHGKSGNVTGKTVM